MRSLIRYSMRLNGCGNGPVVDAPDPDSVLAVVVVVAAAAASLLDAGHEQY